MKTIKHLLTTASVLFFLLCTLAPLSAQVTPKQALKFKPFSFEFAYERALNNTISLQLAGRFLPIKISADDGEDESSFGFSSYQLTPEARIYLAKNKALSGFFVAPHFKYGFLRTTIETESNNDLRAEASFKGSTIGAGLTIGWQWVMGQGFTIDTQFGWGYTHRRFRDAEVVYEDGTREVESAPLELTLMLPRVGFSIGYAF
ncbi:MAG: DUF3575 domain-containing protein [Bacteroidota bacterium]